MAEMEKRTWHLHWAAWEKRRIRARTLTACKRVPRTENDLSRSGEAVCSVMGVRQVPAEVGGEDADGDHKRTAAEHGGHLSVSYTHLTLPTICSV